jgi:hypothetical protein
MFVQTAVINVQPGSDCFVEHDLTLVDTKARLIVDLIPNAIP